MSPSPNLFRAECLFQSMLYIANQEAIVQGNNVLGTSYFLYEFPENLQLDSTMNFGGVAN